MIEAVSNLHNARRRPNDHGNPLFLGLFCRYLGLFDLGIFRRAGHGHEFGFLGVHNGKFALWHSQLLHFGRNLGDGGFRFWLGLFFAARDEQ